MSSAGVRAIVSTLDKLLSGAGFLAQGFALIFGAGLRRYVLVPLVINATVFGLAIYYALSRFGAWIEVLLPDYLEWLRFLLWPLAVLVLLLALFYGFTLLANLIGAPFNDRLAEAVARRLGIEVPAARRATGLGSALAAVAGELRKWLYFLLLMAGVAVLWLVPPLAPLAPLLWLALSFWMLAFEYLDYPLDNAGLDFAGKRRWLRERRALSLGFGAAVLAASLVPVVNFAVMPAAVAGATALWQRHGET